MKFKGLFILTCILFAPSLFGQALTSLTGTVTDPSGAVVPQASVVLESIDRGVKRDTVSDAQGRYNFPQVAPGAYRLLASFKGFADVSVSDVRLMVNTPATINIQFEKVGTIAETVSVSAEAVQVNTTDASIGNAFGTHPIIELPFEARNVASLLSLQPGVTYIGNAEDITNDFRQGSVAGGRSDQANVTLDGIDVNDQQNRYAFTSVLRATLDSVQEFRVTTVNPTADMGRSGGAQVALATKSGTNDFHGSLYEYHRNTLTSANRFFNNAVVASETNPTGGVPRPKLIRNIFGASAGGPAIKNRVFFFGNFEGRRDAREDSVVRTVPSETLRQGIVRYKNTGGGESTLTPDQIKAIDPAGLGVNQAALNVFKSYPMPNTDEVGEGLNTRGYRFTAPVGLRWNTYIARIDTYLDSASKHALFFRGNLQNDRSNTAPQFPGQPPARVNLENSKGLAIGYNAVLSPTIVSTARYGYTRQGTEGSGALTQSVVTLHRDLSSPFATTRGRTAIVPVHQFSEDLSWTKGSHALKFGGVYRNILNERNNYTNSYFSASTNSAWLSGTGIELRRPVADLSKSFNNAYSEAILSVMGGVTQVNSQYNYDIKGNALALGAPQQRNFAGKEYEFYALDTWNVRRGLTITAGLRWSLNPPVYETQGYQTTIQPQMAGWFGQRAALAEAGRSQAEAGDLTFIRKSDPGGRPLYAFHKKDFSPRLAFAYTPRPDNGWRKFLFGGEGKTVIRAGAGLLYDVFGQGIISAFDSNQPGFSDTLQNPAGTLSVAQMPRLTSLFNIPQSLITPPSTPGFPQVPKIGGLKIGEAVDDSIVPPYSINLNFSIGREFTSQNLFVEGSYVGRLSRRLLTSVDTAMPTNMKDPKSGQTFYQAAQVLARAGIKGDAVESIKPLPFFENMFPGAAGDGLTATQNMYLSYRDYAPDYLSALYDADAWCYPSCAITGQYSMFQSQYSALAMLRNVGDASYHAMQWTVRKRFSHGDQIEANYTFSKSLDWGSSVERDGNYSMDGFIINAWNPRQSKAVSGFDMRQQFNVNGVVQLPFGRGQKFASGIGKGLDAVIGGWQLAGIWRWTSALPTYVYNGRAWATEWNLAGYGMPNGPLQTQMGVFKNAPSIDGTGGPNIFADPEKAIASFDFVIPGETGARNSLRGDGYFNIDASVNKRFKMPYKESHSVQLRWEVFNVTNSVRFDPASVSNFLTISGSFGKYSSELVQPRVMQFGLRYEF